MKIKVLYENNIRNSHKNFTAIEIPDGDYSDLLDKDYEQRLAAAPADKVDKVKRCETVQEMFDLMNKEEYNKWHRHQRHIGNSKAQPKDGEEGMEINEPLPEEVLDDRIFRRDEARREQEEDDAEFCAKLRAALKPDYAEMLIAIHIEGMSCIEYAATIGQKPNTVNHRLQRAEKKFIEIFSKHPF